MVFEFSTFPIEIQETILGKLTGQTLLNVSKVCKLWHDICEWLIKEKFLKIISYECIQEIINAGETENIWLTAAANYFLQKFLINNMLIQEKNVAIELNESQHLCFCVYGPLILVGCDSGNIDIYNPEQGNLPVLTLSLLKKPITYLEVMTYKKILLVKAGRNDLEFFSLPYFSGKSWVYNMIHLKPIFQNYSSEFHCERNFSTDKDFLAVATTARELCVFKMNKVNSDSVELEFQTNHIVTEAIGRISLWQNEAIVLFKSGEILRWCLSTQASTVSERYHEIHYENPVWIYRGRIFCSTLISSQLLGYWRMTRGTDYWLLGRPSCDLIRCRDLGTMLSAEMGVEDVLCVCLNQRLLGCGTKDGKILLYYLSDKFFSDDEFNQNGNEHLKTEFNRVPDLTIRTKERPLKNLNIQFGENFIKIYTWPYMVKSGPGSKGFLQCIVLKEGDWVEQQDRELLDF